MKEFKFLGLSPAQIIKLREFWLTCHLGLPPDENEAPIPNEKVQTDAALPGRLWENPEPGWTDRSVDDE